METTTPIERQKAIIVGLSARSLPGDQNSTPETLDELALLVETAGGECAGRVMQYRPAPDAGTFIGEGKAAEVAEAARGLDATMVVFDSELTPSQKRNLEKKLDLQVLDRSGLILDIFAGRAKTAEGKLQVELAQYKYLLPRLTGKGIELSRQGGTAAGLGIGARGPGETKLESDRKHIRSRIEKIEDDLEDVRRQRALSRRQRQKREIPVVSIVGYTNAGKSTLINALTGAGLPAADRLFETLDTTARELVISDTLSVVITDTVGFIRKLPHHLIKAFRATLEELADADLILHVIDGSSPEWNELSLVCERILDDLCDQAIPRLRVFNKMDKITDPDNNVPPESEGVAHISALTGQGLDGLISRIGGCLDAGRRDISVVLPYDQSGLLDMMHTQAGVKSVDYRGDGIYVDLRCDEKIYARLAQYVK